MKLHDIALKNIIRRKSRAIIVMTGIIAGTGSFVAVMKYTGAMTEEINHRMEKYGANIIVTPKSDELTLSYGGFNAAGISFSSNEIPAKSLDKISTIKNAANIAAAGPMLIGKVSLNSKSILAAGIDLKKISVLKPWWKISGRMPDRTELLSGSKAARVLRLEEGDTVTVNGHKMRVSGIIAETGSQDDGMVFTTIETAQSLMGKKGKITMIEVAALCNACPVNEMVAQISEKLPDAEVKALQQIVSGRMETVSQIRNVSFTLSAVITTIGILVVFVTTMGSVRERRSEIGILRAIGYRKSAVIRIILTETGIISMAGGLAGYAAGTAAAIILASFSSGSEGLMIHSSPSGAALSVIFALAAGLIAGFYPAVTASNLDPSEALRSI